MRIGHLPCVAGLIAILLCAAPGHAIEVNLHLGDGRVINGELVSEDENTVTVSVSGIHTRFDRTDVRRIERLQSTAEQYAQRRAEIADDDIDSRYALIYWVYERREYDLALRELDKLAQDAPEDRRIGTLRQAIAQQLRDRQDRPTRPAPGQQPTQPQQQPRQPQAAGEMLNEEQINLIKVYEIDLATRPPVVVPREVIDRVLNEYADRDVTPKGHQAQTAFRRAPGWQQLRLIFELRARELYPLVRVRTDPPALAQFRREVHNQYVVAYCATVQCHGGENVVGGLYLFRDGRRPEEQAYTNFFILNQYENAAGRMINRNDPSRSLLLQYGLDRRAAKTPHPDVPGWRAQFHAEDAPRFRTIRDWVGTLFNNPPPPANYDIQYTPPGAPAVEEGAGDAAADNAPTS